MLDEKDEKDLKEENHKTPSGLFIFYSPAERAEIAEIYFLMDAVCVDEHTGVQHGNCHLASLFAE